MKRLYSCSARYSSSQLISYATTLYQADAFGYHFLYVYRSNTSMSHIRKYIKALREDGYTKRANIVEMLYRLCIDQKVSCAVYNENFEDIYMGTYDQCEEYFLTR